MSYPINHDINCKLYVFILSYYRHGEDKMKEKDMKITRYGTYISQLVSEIKSLKPKNTAPAENIPVNEVVTKLSKENEELHLKVKKVSDEMKAGKSALKKAEENNVVLAKSIRDLQDKLNCEKNRASKTEVEKKRLERNADRLEEIIVINEEKNESKDKRTEIIEEG